MNKPKLLVITSSYPKYKGDINGNFIYELSLRLTGDFDVHVLVPMYKGASRYEEIESIKIHRHKQFIFDSLELAYGVGIYENLKKNKLKFLALPFYFLFLILAFIRIVRKENIKVCHAHWLIPNALIAIICKKIFFLKIKIITTIHGSDIWGFENKLGTFLKLLVLRNIDVLTVVSRRIKERVIELGYNKEIYVYPMGVDTNLFTPKAKSQDIRNEYNIEGFFLLFVGALVEQKGIRNLIQAMPMVLQKFQDAKLFIVGDGHLKEELITLAKTLKIEKCIVFTGAIPHHALPPFFATADLLILPSFSEGFGLVIIEAMSCKTLVVSSPLPVFHDIIKEETTGFFFEHLTPYSINEKIVSILSKIDDLGQIKESARNYVVSNFDWVIVKNNYLNLYNNNILAVQ